PVAPTVLRTATGHGPEVAVGAEGAETPAAADPVEPVDEVVLVAGRGGRAGEGEERGADGDQDQKSAQTRACRHFVSLQWLVVWPTGDNGCPHSVARLPWGLRPFRPVALRLPDFSGVALSWFLSAVVSAGV